MKAKKKAVKKGSIKAQPVTNITNCNLTGVHWDESAVEAVTMIAQGLIENARALGKLAEVLKASNVTIETLISVKG